MRQKRTKRKRTKYQRKHQTKKRKNKRQYGGFLNRYDFAYAWRDTVNQAAKVAPEMIKAATNNLNKIAEQRLNQIISQGGKELGRVVPKLLRGTIEDVYHTPFRMLGNLGKKTFSDVKRKILK